MEQGDTEYGVFLCAGQGPQMPLKLCKCPGHLQFSHGTLCGTPTVKIHKATLVIASSFEDKTNVALSDGREARIADSRN